MGRTVQSAFSYIFTWLSICCPAPTVTALAAFSRWVWAMFLTVICRILVIMLWVERRKKLIFFHFLVSRVLEEWRVGAEVTRGRAERNEQSGHRIRRISMYIEDWRILQIFRRRKNWKNVSESDLQGETIVRYYAEKRNHSFWCASGTKRSGSKSNF